uniref:Uncharacterized protein n=1 Tax=Setaria italica TaxID=4555 RepID=K3ZL00_SETIT
MYFIFGFNKSRVKGRSQPDGLEKCDACRSALLMSVEVQKQF